MLAEPLPGRPSHLREAALNGQARGDTVPSMASRLKALVFPGRSFRGNPYFALFCKGLNEAGIRDVRLSQVLKLRSDFDVAHFHFPEHVVTQGNALSAAVRTQLLLLVLCYARIRRRPVVWMVHNVQPLEAKKRAVAVSIFLRTFTKFVDGYVFLSRCSMNTFRARFPLTASRPAVVAPHGRYPTTLHPREQLDEWAASQFGIAPGEFVIGYLGDIKPYKGPERLRSISPPAGVASVTLAVVGALDHGLGETELERCYPTHPAVRTLRVPGRPSDADMARWVQRANVVVMPYDGGTNSGMALNVLSNRSRILASCLDIFQEMRDDLGSPWIACTDFRDPSSIAQELSRVAGTPVTDEDLRNLDAYLERGDYARNGRRLRLFYDHLATSQAQEGLRRPPIDRKPSQD